MQMRRVIGAMFGLAVLGVSSCTGSPSDAPPKAPTAPGESAVGGGAPAPKPADPAPSTAPVVAAPPFAPAPGWDGPKVTAMRTSEGGALLVRIEAPTAGYTLTLDAVVVKNGAREVQVTLMQPPSDAIVAQVVTPLELPVEAKQIAGAEPLAVAVRRMQVGCHYFAPPPWLRAVIESR